MLKIDKKLQKMYIVLQTKNIKIEENSKLMKKLLKKEIKYKKAVKIPILGFKKMKN